MDTDRIGPYRIVEPLGRGAMGVVYRARHTTSARAVALKTVKVASPRLLDSIRREIHALRRIHHPGVVRIVEDGVHHGRPWYAMDLLEGENLRRFGQRLWSPYRARWLGARERETMSVTDAVSGAVAGDTTGLDARASLDRWGTERPPAAGGALRTALQITRRICATLAFLHGEGFINCDLKPENILLVDGAPVIVDFGLTTSNPSVSSREALEAHGGMSGTLPYMSPEQIRGEFLDARSDLYSIGCLLYELVTGAPPFDGDTQSVLVQHLSAAPVPPTEVVTGVSQELERLILRLLEKDLADRFGHADEVASELAALSEDIRQLPNFPPARSYLYRSRFVGREAFLEDLARRRDEAFCGRGALVLIGGESGVGKTRLAMELTRVGSGSRIQVVTSEASPLPPDSSSAIGPAPLHALRPLLQAVADRCQEGGPDVTERLLGDRRSVLALYEPLLAQVPAHGPAPVAIPLDTESSRRRLFQYLAETVAEVARDQPLFLVLDDVGWADELSLSFLQSLTPEYLASTRVFILGTYRIEEASPALAALLHRPHATNLTLPRLAPAAVHSMVADMLALRDPPSPFVEFVAGHAEGNPFFVAEYLRTAVAEQILYRNQRHSWQVLGRDDRAPSDYQSLQLPRSLRELIEQRLRSLTPAARQTALAAAVLGREADVESVRVVASVSDDTAVSAIDELLRRQVFEQPEAGRVRFAHDKLREVAYRDASHPLLCELHARAAESLEARWHGVPIPSQLLATLGHHFAVAKRPEPAARYFKLAAEHARATYANDDAIRSYRQAIQQVNGMLLQLESDATRWRVTLIELQEALADVLGLAGQREEARASYEQALAGMEEAHRAARSRLYRKIGKTWETQHEHADALRNYSLASLTIEGNPSAAPEDERDEWINARVDQLWVYYWLNQVPEMHRLCRELAPVIESGASPLQRARFLRTLWMRNLRRDRYVATEETVRYARAALAASNESGDAAQLLADQFGMGFVLMFQHQIDEAAASLQAALAMAERGGDLGRQARCLAYLALTARMRRDLDAAAAFTDRGADVASRAGMRDYVAAARANRAWLALRRGDSRSALSLAQEALDIWKALSFAFPLQWIALIPLLDAALSTGDLRRAVACAEAVLDPSQQLLGGSASDALARAARCWASGDAGGATSALELGLNHLDVTGYR